MNDRQELLRQLQEAGMSYCVEYRANRTTRVSLFHVPKEDEQAWEFDTEGALIP